MSKLKISIAALLAAWLCPGLLAQPKCIIHNLVGKWSISSSGWAIMTAPGPWPPNEAVPVAGLGILSIDSSGKLSGPGTIAVAGMTFDYEAVGSVELNSDCTGLLLYTVKMKGFPDLPGYVERFVFDLGRQEMTTVSKRTPISKPMWVSTMKRITVFPGAVVWPDIPALN